MASAKPMMPIARVQDVSFPVEQPPLVRTRTFLGQLAERMPNSRTARQNSATLPVVIL